MTIDSLAQDVRVCLRSLLRAPMLALTVVTTVGLGIGATTAIFAALDAALLQPLPYADPGRLVRIYTDAPPNRFPFSVADYLALEAQQTHFERIAGYASRQLTYSDGVVAERVQGRLVTWTYFQVLGIRPALGRDFTEIDGRPGSPPAVLVSHGFWERRLGGRADAVGSTIRLDGMPYAIAGVLPRTLGPLEQRQELFVAAQWSTPPRKGPFFITAIARLRAGVAPASAADELRTINRRIFPLWRSSYQDDRATWSMTDLKTHVTGDVRTVAGLALTAVALVWLIACANASNLLIARVTSRRRELAVRTALGASRGRVVRHLLVESGVLALASAAVGIALAWLGMDLLRDVGAGYFPRTQEVALDGRALWVLAALMAASALLFGLIPAVHGSAGPMDESLRSSGRSATGGVAARRLRRALVGCQFAIATPLLASAGLLIVSLNQLGRVDLGFDSRNLLSGSIALPAAQYPEPGNITSFWEELRTRIEALPGVTAAAFADGRPPNDVNNFNNFDLEDSPTPPGQSQPVTPWLAVTPEYFRLLGLTLVEGRLFDERDGGGPALEVVVVDRAWAKRFFPNESAIGKRFKEGGCTTCPWTSVVGVVSEVKYAGLDQPDQGTVYSPMTRIDPAPSRLRYLIMRTQTDPAAMLSTVRQTIRGLDPSLPFSSVATIDELVVRSLQRPRSLTLLVGSFAIVALVLSIVGIYGVMAYYVEQHSKDIGIRLALGGSPRDVLRLIVGQGMAVVSIGLAIGLVATILVTRWISSLLFAVSPGDASTLLAVSVLLIVVGLTACLVPAARAVRLDPSMVLREE